MADIKCPVKECVVISGKEAALVEGDALAVYSQLDVFVSATAGRLHELGFKPGDRVGLRVQPRMRAVVLVLALWRLGATVCPLHPGLPLEAVRRRSQEIGTSRLLDDLPGDLDGLDRIHTDDAVRQIVEDLDLELPERLDLKREAAVISTSGSSGAAKFVPLTHGNLYYSARAANHALKLSSDSRWLMSLPLYHVAGLSVIRRCTLAGAAMVFQGAEESLSATIARHGITHMSAVPTQLLRWMEAEETAHALASLRVLLVGGAPLSSELLERALSHQIPVMATYGMTETSSMVTLQNPFEDPPGRGSCGRALRHSDVRIASEGEIQVKGPVCCPGVLSSSGMIDLRDEEGWMPTGDIGSMDKEGRLTVRGRKDSMFISGGENVYPEQIEEAMARLSSVRRAVVVPVPDPEFGQRPVAFVDREPSGGSEDQLRQALEEFLPRFMIPIRFLAWPEEIEDGMKIDRAQFARRVEDA